MKNYFIFFILIIFTQMSFALRTNEDLVKYWANINYDSCPEGAPESAAKRATFKLAPLLFNQCSGQNLKSDDKNTECYRAITAIMQITENNPLRDCERKNYNIDPLKPRLATPPPVPGTSAEAKTIYDANVACKAISKPAYQFKPTKISDNMYTCISTFECPPQFTFGAKTIQKSSRSDYDFYCGQYPKMPTKEICDNQNLSNCSPALGYQKKNTLFSDEQPVFLVEFDRLGGLKVKTSGGTVGNPGSGQSGR